MKDQYLLLKTLISLSYVDYNLHPKEKLFLENLIKRSGLRESQKQELISFFDNPDLDYLTSFCAIESYSARNKLIDLSRVLLNIDGKFSTGEKKAYDELLSNHKLLSPNLEKETKNAAKAMAQLREDKVFYKELEIFGKVLSIRLGYLDRYWILSSPLIFMYFLFSKGKLARRFGIIILVLYVLYFLVKFLVY